MRKFIKRLKARIALNKKQFIIYKEKSLAKDLLIEPLTEDAIKEYDDDIEKSINSKGIRNKML